MKLTTWSEGRDPSESGIAVNGKQISVEDLEEVASREEAEALGIPGDLYDHGQAEYLDWAFHWWLEESAN